MSQFVEMKGNTTKEGNGNRDSKRFSTQRTRRPMCGDQLSYQPRTSEPIRPEIPKTTIVGKSNCQENQCAETPKRKVIHYFLEKKDTNQLQTCKNAWIPSRAKNTGNNNCHQLSEEDAKLEEIRKKFMSILNKISPENMALLTDDIMTLPIDTENCLKKIIELLFQKAIDEPNFIPQYAYICVALHKKESNTKSKMSFKNLLTKCCQDRFYQMHAHKETLAKSLKEIAECNDQGVKEKLQSQYDLDEMVYRKRSVGNSRFMCELHKVTILTNRTLEMSMKYLLKSPNEETIECACSIVKHTGKMLSHKATFKKLTEYTSPSNKTKIPTRIRFMIQDLIELKENNWVPRNLRPKEQPCNTKAPQNAVTPVVRYHRPVQYAPPVPTVTMSSMKNTQKLDEQKINTILPTNVTKVEVCPKSEVIKKNGLESPSLPVDSNDIAQSQQPLVEPCVGRVTETINNRQSSSDEFEDIREKCHSILDNLTPENMISKANSMNLLPIKTDECLKTVVEILFEKAMDIPELTPQYANICSSMKNIEVHSKEQKTKTSFKKLLIAMCQNAFESMFIRKSSVAKDRAEIENCKDKEMRKTLQSKFDRNELDYRRHSVANCRFMCELLKVNILVPPILDICTAQLIECPKETSIECVCVIIKHSWDVLNYTNICKKLHEYTTSHKKLSSRIRSMIVNTLKLENNDLVPSNTGDKPPLLDDTNDSHLIESSIDDVKQLLTDVHPVMPFIQENKHQESTNVYKIVESVIDSVTVDNMNTTINELSTHIMNIQVMEKTVDLIFKKANARPESIPELVKICSLLKNVSANPAKEHSKPISLKKQVSIHCNQVLHSGIQNDSSGDGCTHKEPFSFVGELFNANVISAHNLIEFIQIIPDELTNRGLDNTCCLLKAAGKKIDRVYNLKKPIEKLTNMVANDVTGVYSRRSNVLLEELVELHIKKWVTLEK